jgi:hypothetical protein
MGAVCVKRVVFDDNLVNDINNAIQNFLFGLLGKVFGRNIARMVYNAFEATGSIEDLATKISGIFDYEILRHEGNNWAVAAVKSALHTYFAIEMRAVGLDWAGMLGSIGMEIGSGFLFVPGMEWVPFALGGVGDALGTALALVVLKIMDALADDAVDIINKW